MQAFAKVFATEFDAGPETLAEDLTRLCRELADRGLLEIVSR